MHHLPGTPIDIAVPCGLGSEGYFAFLAETLLAAAHRPDAIRFIAGINNGADPAVFQRLGRQFPVTVVEIPVTPTRGQLGAQRSLNHGICLDALFSHITAPLGMFCDCDIAALHQGWDERLIGCLDHRVAVVGSAYAPGSSKYQGFPNVCLCLFDTMIVRGCGISFRAMGRTVVLQSKDAEIFGLPEGTAFYMDTGFELPWKLRRAGHDGLPLAVCPAGSAGAGVLRQSFPQNPALGPFQPEEIQLEGVPLFSHMGKSEIRPMGVDPGAVAWEKAVRRWLDEKRICIDTHRASFNTA